MFKKEEMFSNEASVALQGYADRFEYPQSGDIDEINDKIENLLYGLKAFEGLPSPVLTRSLYPTEENGNVLDYASFVIRPRVADKVDCAPDNARFTVHGGEDFFHKFVKELGEWFDDHAYYVRVQQNLDELNAVVQDIVEEEELGYTLKFALGDGIIDATDDSVVVGLSHQVVNELADLPLFDEAFETRREKYRSRLVDVMKEVVRPYDIVHVNSPVTKALGIYSRKTTHKMLRGFVSRKVEQIRVGTGYYETDSVFAIVTKEAVTEERASELKEQGVHIIDNEKPSSVEKARDLVKVAVRYKVSPFQKKDGVREEVALAEIV